MREGIVRPISIGFVKLRNQILVIEGYDQVKKIQFYRPAGGGIEIGETSQEALVREYREEFNIAVSIVKKLGILENIFTFQGKLGHEIVFVYEIRMKDQSLYNLENFQGKDDDNNLVNAKWIDLQEFELGKAVLYPEGLLELIKS